MKAARWRVKPEKLDFLAVKLLRYSALWVPHSDRTGDLSGNTMI